MPNNSDFKPLYVDIEVFPAPLSKFDSSKTKHLTNPRMNVRKVVKYWSYFLKLPQNLSDLV